MAEYIEREALLKDISETVVFTVSAKQTLPTTEMRGANKVIDRIKYAPTTDVVEVVRCKDCKYAIELDKYEKQLFLEGCVACKQIHQQSQRVVMLPNSFCSYGIKRGEDNGSKNN